MVTPWLQDCHKSWREVCLQPCRVDHPTEHQTNVRRCLRRILLMPALQYPWTNRCLQTKKEQWWWTRTRLLGEFKMSRSHIHITFCLTTRSDSTPTRKLTEMWVESSSLWRRGLFLSRSCAQATTDSPCSPSPLPRGNLCVVLLYSRARQERCRPCGTMGTTKQPN